MNNNLHPKSAQARFLQLPQDPRAIPNHCTGCGQAITAVRVEHFGATRYLPSRCGCLNDELREKVLLDQKRAIHEVLSRQVHTWLGGPFTTLALREKTFANFDQSAQPEAYQSARDFVDILSGTLVLDGSFGTGKTHLLAAISNALLEKERPIGSLFTTTANLFAAIQQRIKAHEDYHTLLQRAITTPLLCIDDVEKAKRTDFREEIYFAIVDGRVIRGLPIALSTNNLEDLHLYTGGAVASRFKVGQILVKMVGQDYREHI